MQTFLLEKHQELFTDKTPEVAVTYMWLGVPLLELVAVLLREFGANTLVWLDIVFNDQRSNEAVLKAVRRTLPAAQRGIRGLVCVCMCVWEGRESVALEAVSEEEGAETD